MEHKEVKRGEVFYADLSPVVGSEQGGVRPAGQRSAAGTGAHVGQAPSAGEGGADRPRRTAPCGRGAGNQLRAGDVLGQHRTIHGCRLKCRPACIFSGSCHKKPREYTKYSLRFLFKLQKKSAGAIQHLELCGIALDLSDRIKRRPACSMPGAAFPCAKLQSPAPLWGPGFSQGAPYASQATIFFAAL